MAEILRYQVDLLGTLFLELLRFAHQPLERLGPVPAAHQGYRAERATMVAPLGDLEIAYVRAVTEIPAYARVRPDRIRNQPACRKLRHQFVEIPEPQEEIHFRHIITELFPVALHEATDRDDRLHAPFPFERGGFEHRLDRLALGGVDEPTRIDQDNVRLIQLSHDLGPMTDQIADQPLRIDGGLVAAHGDDAELHDGKIGTAVEDMARNIVKVKGER